MRRLQIRGREDEEKSRKIDRRESEVVRGRERRQREREQGRNRT